MMNFIESLLNSSLFKGINETEIQTIIDCIKPKIVSYKKGEIIVSEGELLEELGVVLSGVIDVAKETVHGEKIILNKVRCGEMFGEIAVLSDLKTAPATIFSCEESNVLFLSTDKILTQCTQMCDWHKKLTKNLIEIIANKALHLNRKIDFLVIKGMRGKLCTYFYEIYKKTGKSKVKLSFNRNELADFLNVSRPSMSRELGRMRDEGIIAFDKKEVNILDLEQLLDYVE